VRVFKDIHRLPGFQRAVLTIGTFDGVHAGHQALINRLKSLVGRHGGESVILTFEPHPRLVLDPSDRSVQLITTLDEKIEVLNRHGVDNLVVAPFSKAFADLTAEEYIRYFLVAHFHPEVVVIGYNHHFGRNRQGNIDLLRTYGRRMGFAVEEIPRHLVDNIAVSSTKVRKAILTGELRQANQLLGHRFVLTGMVVKGHQMGKELGFPTANLKPSHPNKIIPADGVYAAQIKIAGANYKGMLYIGNRPTFNGQAKAIEVNIFDFEKDIYGQRLQVALVAEIRKDMKFDTAEGLIEQLKKDKAASEKLLG